MKTPSNVQCNALPMMVVTSGSRCDLQSCCHAPPYRGLSSHGGLKESPRSKGWCISLVKRDNLRFISLAGTRVSHKNLLKFRYQGNTPCVTGCCSSVTGPELCTPFTKAFLVKSPRGKLGKRFPERIERSRVRCNAERESGETHGKLNENRGGGAKRSEPIERVLSSRDTWEAIGQGSSRLFYQQQQGTALGGGVSNSEYQKIQDLKFSGDLWEGDSGPQVLDLQVSLQHYSACHIRICPISPCVCIRSVPLFQVLIKDDISDGDIPSVAVYII